MVNQAYKRASLFPRVIDICAISFYDGPSEFRFMQIKLLEIDFNFGPRPPAPGYDLL